MDVNKNIKKTIKKITNQLCEIHPPSEGRGFLSLNQVKTFSADFCSVSLRIPILKTLIVDRNFNTHII